MEASPRLGDWIEGRTDLLDCLDHPKFADLHVPDDVGMDAEQLKIARRGLVRLYYTLEFDYGELSALTVDSEEPQTVIDVVDEARDWVNTRVFRASMHLMRGNMEPALFVGTLSRIMDTAIDVLLQANASKFGQDRSLPEGAKCAVIAFGDLGRGELSLDSTLDVTLLYDGADVSGGIDKAINGLADRLFRSVDALGRQNLLFEQVVSSCGGTGEGVQTLSMSGFESRFAPGGTFSSAIALASARAACGDEHVVRTFNDRRRELLAAWASEGDSKRQVAGLRGGLEGPASDAGGLASLNALKRAPGGIADLRLMADYAALLSATGAAATDSAPDPFAAAAGCGALDAEAAEELGNVHKLWRNLGATLPFTASRQRLGDPPTTAMDGVIAAACDAESLVRVVEDAEASRHKAAARIDQLLGAA